MLILRPTALFVLAFVIFAAIDLFVINTGELVEHTYAEVLASDMYVLVLTAAAVVALVEFLVRKRAGAEKT